MNYYNEIKDKLVKNEVVKMVREYQNNRSDLTTYYEVGKLLSEAGKHYGEGIIEKYSLMLTDDLGKKYSSRMLRSMRQFYLTFLDRKWNPVVSKLSWSQIIILMRIKNPSKMDYYINQCEQLNISKRDLEKLIKNKEYERLSDDAKNKLINNNKIEVSDLIKDPIIIKKNKDYDKISEFVLKEMILDDLSNFLKQLGTGFCYIDNEYKIKLGNTYNYIDILLFNIEFNCYVVVELKVTKLLKEHIGQVEIYMNYVDSNIRKISQNKTIGIIVCRENNQYVIKYSTDSRIHAITYEVV